MTALNLETMSRLEKLQAMHLLWEDLVVDDEAVESPSWHLDALAATADEVKAGRVKELDWEVAKRELRDRAR